MFEQCFIEKTGRTARPWTVSVSFLAQAVLIGGSILVPLISTDVLPRTRLGGWILEPPPPGGNSNKPARRATAARSPHRRYQAQLGLVQPGAIPPRVVILDETQLPAAPSGRFGVPGGIETPDGSPGSPLMTGIISSAAPSAPPAPPAPVRTSPTPPAPPAEPVLVGGKVQMAKLIHRVLPVYPTLAKQAGITGVVHLQAVISKDGRIRELRTIDGHPLLVPAALEAVRQWVYQPTLLNGEPVEVLTQVDVNFSLTR